MLLPDPGAPTHEHSPKHRLSRLCARSLLLGEPQVVQQTSLAWSVGGRRRIKEWNDFPPKLGQGGEAEARLTLCTGGLVSPGGNGAPTHCRHPPIPGPSSVQGHVPGWIQQPLSSEPSEGCPSCSGNAWPS